MEIKEILASHGFRYNKALGQNFITDKNLLNAVATDANVGVDDVVVEIGAGAGTLTSVLCARCKKVYAFEVDRNLEPILQCVLKDFTNVEVHFCDILSMDDDAFRDICNQPFTVVANLPYYITTPLLMRFLESSLPWKSLSLMMQKEVAERLTAQPGTSAYGSSTVAAEIRGDGQITRIVPARMFTPMPKVDSALFRLDRRDDKYEIVDEKLFRNAVKSAFLWRRKTLANNLKSMFSISKESCDLILSDLGLSPTVRGETLSAADFVALCTALKKYK